MTPPEYVPEHQLVSHHASDRPELRWMCRCGWRPTSASRQSASVHRHITMESKRAYREQRAAEAEAVALAEQRARAATWQQVLP